MQYVYLFDMAMFYWYWQCLLLPLGHHLNPTRQIKHNLKVCYYVMLHTNQFKSISDDDLTPPSNNQKKKASCALGMRKGQGQGRREERNSDSKRRETEYMRFVRLKRKQQNRLLSSSDRLSLIDVCLLWLKAWNYSSKAKRACCKIRLGSFLLTREMIKFSQKFWNSKLQESAPESKPTFHFLPFRHWMVEVSVCGPIVPRP